MPVWLPALLLTITCFVDVWMAHARPFFTPNLQDLSNGINNTSRRGVLTLVMELWSFGSPIGLQVPTFGNASFILTLASKWGYEKFQSLLWKTKQCACIDFGAFPINNLLANIRDVLTTSQQYEIFH